MPDSSQHAAELIRVAVLPSGAFGVLKIDGRCQCVTLERTYEVLSEGSPRQVTKIPEGKYLCRRTVYHRGGYETYEVTGVVGHDRLLIHSGNKELDSEGCILVGQRYESGGPVPLILDSRLAHTRLMHALDGAAEFLLTVRNA